MKTIEQKAKAYDEALERAKNINNEHQAQPFDVMTRVFPELKESKNESIRKTLIKFHKSTIDIDGIKGVDIISWLEKQGKNDMGISETTRKVLEDNLNKALEKETPESLNEFLDKQGEQKPVWSEEDEEMCQETIDWFEKKCFPYALEEENPAKNSINWLKSLKDRYTWKPSEEQLNALDEVYKTHSANNTCRRIIFNLLKQLKKL